TAAHAESLKVHANDGQMNVRTGPGTNYALIGVIPNGTVISWPDGRPVCVPRQDGIAGAEWCKVNMFSGALVRTDSPYNQVGWVSRAGLLPVTEGLRQPPIVPSSASNADIICNRPVIDIGDDSPDTNPVIMMEVSYSRDHHSWRVFHHLLNGGVVS